MAVTNFKDLIAWQKAMELAVAVYETTRTFPSDERFALTSQLRRAAVSIPSNIAEGQGRGAGKEFRNFLRIANGSRQEVETQLDLARRLGFISAEAEAILVDRIHELGRIIRGLAASIV